MELAILSPPAGVDLEPERGSEPEPEPELGAEAGPETPGSPKAPVGVGTILCDSLELDPCETHAVGASPFPLARTLEFQCQQRALSKRTLHTCRCAALPAERLIASHLCADYRAEFLDPEALEDEAGVVYTSYHFKVLLALRLRASSCSGERHAVQPGTGRAACHAASLRMPATHTLFVSFVPLAKYGWCCYPVNC